jgi:hypothetical protein
MKMPMHQPSANHLPGDGNFASGIVGVLVPQGCNYLACAVAIAQCAANPNPAQCILNIAPNCIDCVPH